MVMHWGEIKLDSLVLPDVTRSDIDTISDKVLNHALNGKAHQRVTYQKYKYTLVWDWMKIADYNALETYCNELKTRTFIYNKFPQSADPGVEVTISLSDRTPKVYYANKEYYSSVTLTLIEVAAR
jgi:hypothetical protein